MIRALQVWLSLAVLGAGPGRLLMERTATVVCNGVGRRGELPGKPPSLLCSLDCEK